MKLPTNRVNEDLKPLHEKIILMLEITFRLKDHRHHQAAGEPTVSKYKEKTVAQGLMRTWVAGQHRELKQI